MPTASAPGVGLENFFSPPYQAHNRARLEHLASLGLPLSGCRVLELGSGPGDHTGFYVERDCRVVAVDSRQECLDTLRERYPSVQTVLCDLNSPAPLAGLGPFDAIHCYGVLYHLNDPRPLIQLMGTLGAGLAVVETCVSASRSVAWEEVDEPAADYTQSSTGRGCRPSRQWVFDALGLCFPFVYHTRTQPNHPEFPIDWNRPGHVSPLTRSVFVASRQPLDMPSLSATLLDTQERLDMRIYIAELEATLTAQQAVMREREELILRVHAEAAATQAQLIALEERAASLESAARDRLEALLNTDAAFKNYLRRTSLNGRIQFLFSHLCDLFVPRPKSAG